MGLSIQRLASPSLYAAPKRNAIVICFLHAVRAEMTDSIIEMQDKLITSIHNKARKRYDDVLRATEKPGAGCRSSGRDGNAGSQ